MTKSLKRSKQGPRQLKNSYPGMHVKADYCRLQEAYQLNLAAHDPVESRRIAALAAAEAWRLEAIKSEKREAKTMEPLVKRDAKITCEIVKESMVETTTTLPNC